MLFQDHLLSLCLCFSLSITLYLSSHINRSSPAWQTPDYFSYEHFYVIYTSFWKLDTDHDLRISREELARYGDEGKQPCLLLLAQQN